LRYAFPVGGPEDLKAVLSQVSFGVSVESGAELDDVGGGKTSVIEGFEVSVEKNRR
jgi:hypothetical protein